MIITIEEFYRYSVLEVMDEIGVYDDYNFMKLMEVAPNVFVQMGFDWRNMTDEEEERYFFALVEIAEVLCRDEI